MKFGFPMAASATLLAWSILDFKRGYQHAGQYDWALEEIKWATDYFLNCNHHLGQGENKFWVQVYNTNNSILKYVNLNVYAACLLFVNSNKIHVNPI